MKQVSRRFWRPAGLMLLLTLGFSLLTQPLAHAAENISDLQNQVEQTAQAYNDAQRESDELQKRIEENQSRIQDIKEALPTQIVRASGALKAQYKVQHEGFSLFNMLLQSRDLKEFLATFDYLNLIQERNNAQINALKALNDELEVKRNQLLEDKTQADKKTEEARQALEHAKDARQKAQEAAKAEAERQQAQAAAAIAAARVEIPAPKPEALAPAPTAPTTIPSSVDWSADKQAFVAQWAGRINNYLAGSPLAGTGETFASAAWDYGVDPRWSPAISFVESSKGAVCFRPHNAWGWGNSSWGSWDEAIRAHVAGLARGYGGNLTPAAARKYCPPNSDHWYASCLAQMNLI